MLGGLAIMVSPRYGGPAVTISGFYHACRSGVHLVDHGWRLVNIHRKSTAIKSRRFRSFDEIDRRFDRSSPVVTIFSGGTGQHLPAADTHAMADADPEDWSVFATEWDRLTSDGYMADGTYRLRRYSSFVFDTGTGELAQQPHKPYLQSTTIKHLNGGVERHFDPCTAEFCESPVLLGLLPALGRAFTQAHGCRRWNIKLHPYRIVASSEAAGQPAPEGDTVTASPTS